MLKKNYTIILRKYLDDQLPLEDISYKIDVEVLLLIKIFFFFTNFTSYSLYEFLDELKLFGQVFDTRTSRFKGDMSFSLF